MKGEYKGPVIKDLVWKCATRITTEEFNESMEELRRENEGACKFVMDIQPKHWSRSHFTGRSVCDMLLNNLCEIFNSKLVDDRDKPVITCLEYLRQYLMKRIVTVQKVIAKSNGPLTLTSTRLFEMNKKAANRHAVACIWEMAQNSEKVGDPEDWVNPAYKLETWRKVYSFKVEPITESVLWTKSDCPTKLLPPYHKKQVGRPKKKRRKSANELEKPIVKKKRTTSTIKIEQPMVMNGKLSRVGKSKTCKKCGQLGHNSGGCGKEGARKGKAGARNGKVGAGASTSTSH
ncbi:uncharacterized protein [Rutidosis leptorrhynchoides]|uniref:uncharacterized protein n=1 Tax=Rutidosis leptorrhynchoides TaxID=125765 RepID=UPI003A9A389F